MKDLTEEQTIELEDMIEDAKTEPTEEKLVALCVKILDYNIEIYDLKDYAQRISDLCYANRHLYDDKTKKIEVRGG